MLAERKKLTTNPLTLAEGVSLKVEDVYVPLGLVERKKQSKPKGDVSPQQGSDLYKETAITEIFEHDKFLEEVLRQNKTSKSQGKRIAIIGEPGAGKTTLLQQIADWVYNEIEQSIVIWVSLADLKEQKLEPYLFQTWLTAAVRRKGKAKATEQHENDFTTQFPQERVWLLLDGLDEMPVSSGNPLTEIALQFREGGAISKARIVLTCRVNLWDGNSNTLDDFDTYRTLDFSYPQQVEQFIGYWFSTIPELGKERGCRLCNALQKTGKERIRDLVKNPLRLTLLCLNWQSREGELPDTKAGLYKQFVKDFYKWEKRKFSVKYKQHEELKTKLKTLAKEAIDREANRFRLSEEIVSQYLGDADDESSSLNLALNLGWLNNVGIDRGQPVYAFFHASFQEYFAALAVDDWSFFLNHILNNPNDPSANYRIFKSQWREVFLLWLGNEDVENSQKENLIQSLVNFEDGCQGLYEYQAFF